MSTLSVSAVAQLIDHVHVHCRMEGMLRKAHSEISADPAVASRNELSGQLAQQ